MKINNVRVINYNNSINNADIVIEKGLITKIIPKPGLGLKTVIPGFIDMHIHGFGGYDNMDSRNALKKIKNGLAKLGTTSFLATVMTNSLQKLKKSMSDISQEVQENSAGANILGIHMEGPFFLEAKKGAQNPNFLIRGTTELVDQFQAAANGLIKKISLDPDACNDRVIKYILAKNIIVAIGHTNATFKRANYVLNLGATSCTHIWNGMSGVGNRNPGTTQAILYNDQVYAELICDLIHVDQETINFTIKVKGVAKITCITDSIRPAGLADGEYRSGGLDVIKKGLKITLKNSGSIAGSGATMFDNFKNLLRLGYSLNDVVAMTSYNASVNMGLTKIGILKVGCQADMIVLDQNLEIDKVYIKGKEVQ